MMGVGYRAALCPPPQIASQAAAFHSAEPPMQPAHAAAPSLEGPGQRQALGEKRTRAGACLRHRADLSPAPRVSAGHWPPARGT